jgi:hypothetical protein
MSKPGAGAASPIVNNPPGYTAAGCVLRPLFYEMDTSTGLPTGLVYDGLGNLIPAPNFPAGTGMVKTTAGVQGAAVANTDYVAPGTDRAITASGAAVLADQNALITGNHATVAIEITIPNDATVAWVGSAVLRAYIKGAADVTFIAGAGVTLHAPAVQAHVQYGVIGARRVGANEWTLL